MKDQIVTLYEVEGMSIEAIAESLGLEIESVKLALASSSPKYAKDNKELFSDSDLANASLVMNSLLYSELDAVKYRASKFIINEKLGRNDNLKLLRSNLTNISINNINIQLLKAKEAIKRGKAKINNVKEISV